MSSIKSLGISTQDISRGGDYLGKYFFERGYSVRPTKVTYTNRQESSFCTSSLTDYDLDNSLKNTNLIHFLCVTLSLSEHKLNIALNIHYTSIAFWLSLVLDCLIL